jgi:predicted AlkP superfamily phosphohydrolase/phosphomutase
MCFFLKIFILALDGLEYSLVEKWRLKGLMQKKYGTIDVSEFKDLLTPIMWASFITGQPPEIHGIDSWWTLSSSTKLNSLFHWGYDFLERHRLGVPRFKLRKLLGLFGFDVQSPQKEQLEKKGLHTIFDYAKNPLIIDVPSYNESVETRIRYSKAMEKGISEYEKETWKIHEERVKKIQAGIQGDWDLMMAWIDVADQMGHLYMGQDNMKMFKTYMNLENLAQEIMQTISDEVLLLIVSDHGMTCENNYPIHGKRAFYSFNHNVEWEPKSILDYADFIKDYINL